MADTHIQRLRKLEACPVCGAGLILRAETIAAAGVRFQCDARFYATDCNDILVMTACNARTITAADLLNKECKEVVP